MTTTALTPRTLRHTAPPSSEQRARLLAFEVAGQVRLFELRAEVVRIGRGLTADVGLDDGTVSLRHALILTRPDGTVEVIDEHSADGTYVGGERVQRQVLRHGDVVRVGQTELVFLDTSCGS